MQAMVFKASGVVFMKKRRRNDVRIRFAYPDSCVRKGNVPFGKDLQHGVAKGYLPFPGRMAVQGQYIPKNALNIVVCSF